VYAFAYDDGVGLAQCPAPLCQGRRLSLSLSRGP